MNACPLIVGRAEYGLPKEGGYFASIPEACVPCFEGAVASPDAETTTDPTALARLEATVKRLGGSDLPLDDISFESLERPSDGPQRVARLMVGKRYPAAFDAEAYFKDTRVNFDCSNSGQ